MAGTAPASNERGGANKHEGATERPAAPREKAREAREIGGPKGPEPTRYGDWEKGGRCTDF